MRDALTVLTSGAIAVALTQRAPLARLRLALFGLAHGQLRHNLYGQRVARKEPPGAGRWFI